MSRVKSRGFVRWIVPAALAVLALIYALCLGLHKPTFAIDAECLSGARVTVGQEFSIRVTSRNDSGSAIRYRGSSTLLGAAPCLYRIVDGEEQCFRFYDAQSADLTMVTIPNDYTITYVWRYDAESRGEIPAGVYYLRLSYYQSTVVLENFLEVVAEA